MGAQTGGTADPPHLHPRAPDAEEFEERAKQIDHEEQQRLESAVPVEQPAGLLESAGCEHLREGAACPA